LAFGLLWLDRALKDLLDLSLGIFLVAIFIISLFLGQLSELVDNRVLLLELEM